MNRLFNNTPENKNGKLLLAIVLWLLVLHPECYSQNQYRYFQYTTYNKSNGLNVDESIYHISTDNKGFVWVSTFNGLFRCSGSLFKGFPVKKNVPGSIPSNNIRFFIQDKNNIYWLNPAYKGIWNYNDSLGFFSKLQLVNDTIGIEKYELSYPFIDDENNIWVNLQSKGIIKINTADGHFKFWDLKDPERGYDFRSQSWVNSIYKSKNGTIWLSTNTSLLCLNEKTSQIKKYYYRELNANTEQAISCTFEDNDSSLWLGSWGQGLLHFYPSENKWESFLINPYKKNNTENITNSVLPKNENELWVGSEYGLLIFDKKTKQFYSCADIEAKTNDPEIFYNAKNEQKIAGYTLCFDNKNNLIATDFENKYFNRINLNDQRLNYQLANPGIVLNPGAFYYSSITKIPGQPANFMLSSSWGSGLYVYNSSSRQVKVAKNNSTLSFFNINEVNKQKDLLWLSTDKGLFIFNTRSQKFESVPYPGLEKACAHQEITSLCFSGEHIWAGSYNGLLEYNIKKDSITWRNKENKQIPENAINRLMEDRAGNIWIALGGGMGIACFIKQTGKIKWYVDSSLINTGNGEDITETNEGDILFASRGNGVYKIINPLQKNENIELLTTSDGLASNRVFTLFTDSDGFTWFCTANGLTVYSPSVKQYYSFYKEDGLMNDILLGRCSEISKGIIGLPLKYGFAIINRDSLLQSDMQEMPIAIHRFTINGKAYLHNIQYVRNIQLPYNLNNLSIDFSALTFDRINALEYNYRLVEVNNDWTNINNRTNLTLYALPPGNYTLQLYAENKYTHARGALYQLNIKIIPPFWDTWWFIALMIIFGMAIIYGIYRYRLGQALELERMRTSISSDLHDEVGATLSSISIFSQTAKQLAKTNPQRSAEILERIGESSRKMVDSMSDIVWNINPANDSFDKMLLRMRSYATEILEAKDIVIEWQQAEKIAGLKLSMEQRKNLYLFFKEAVNNIAKYSNAENAFIQFSLAASIMHLKIEDNGIGYDEEKIKKGNGLTTMKARADMLDGNLSVISANNKGVSIYLQFPC